MAARRYLIADNAGVEHARQRDHGALPEGRRGREQQGAQGRQGRSLPERLPGDRRQGYAFCEMRVLHGVPHKLCCVF